MSSDDETAEIVAFYSSIDIYVNIAASVFFAYDCAITFDLEVKYFWRRKVSIASVLCLSIRCKIVQWTNGICQISLYFPFAIFSGARAYALCRGRVLSGLIILLSLAPFGVNWVNWVLNEEPAVDPVFGCDVDDDEQEFIVTIVTLCARIPLMIADILLVVITWRNLDGRFKDILFIKRGYNGFSNVLMCDGTIYFVILFVLNLLHLIFTTTSIFTDGDGPTASELTAFTEPLTGILIYRFILDLQGANKHDVVIGSGDSELQMSTSSQSSLSFLDRALSSLGSTIPPGAAAVDEYDDDTLGEVRQTSSHDSGEPAGPAISLDILVTAGPELEIQEVLRDEPLERVV